MRLVASRAARLLLATVAAAAAALTLGAGKPPAAVAGWTVSPGGSFTGHAGTTELADTTSGQAAIICASSSSRGTFKSGSGLPGASIGSIVAASFRGGCFTLTAGRLPWKVNAKSYQSATGTTVGTITGVHLRFTDPTFCNLTADGTSATAGNGTVRFRYANATGRLQVLRARGDLHIYQVQGCGGVFHDGDTATLSGTYMITPAQTITSP
jgi:hypothetical protein